jgi:hypothetical protein
MKNAFNIDKYEILTIFAALAYGWVYLQMNVLK